VLGVTLKSGNGFPYIRLYESGRLFMRAGKTLEGDPSLDSRCNKDGAFETAEMRNQATSSIKMGERNLDQALADLPIAGLASYLNCFLQYSRNPGRCSASTIIFSPLAKTIRGCE
jgi:hypothetical protein